MAENKGCLIPSRHQKDRTWGVKTSGFFLFKKAPENFRGAVKKQLITVLYLGLAANTFALADIASYFQINNPGRILRFVSKA